MSFDHDHQAGPQLAAALVSLLSRDESKPGLLDEVEDALIAHGIRWPTLSPADALSIHVWTVRLRAVFSADDVGSRCTAVNELLADAGGALYLSTHDDTRPHLHLVPDEQDIVARVRSVTASGLAFFVAWSGGGRLGLCSRSRCGRAYVDASRAGRQRYCSARCGNSDAVARHRGRAT